MYKANMLWVGQAISVYIGLPKMLSTIEGVPYFV